MATREKQTGSGKSRRHSPEVYAPTPQQIRDACEAIQATWSDRERRKRSWVNQPVNWMPPTVQQDLVRGDSAPSRERSYNSLI